MTAICNNKHILTIIVEWIKDSLQGKREGEAPRTLFVEGATQAPVTAGGIK
jgi:hypothetical protein